MRNLQKHPVIVSKLQSFAKVHPFFIFDNRVDFTEITFKRKVARVPKTEKPKAYN